MSCVRYKSLGELRFLTPGSETVVLEVPNNLNQNLLPLVKWDEYLVMVVSVGRSVAESEVCELKVRNSTVGFLIPGQSILSPDQQLNPDAKFGAYSLRVAAEVCSRSFSGDYRLSRYSESVADPGTAVFLEDALYLVVWLPRLGVTAADFTKCYFVSLASHGVCSRVIGKRPRRSQRTLDSYAQPLKLSKNQPWPAYIQDIVTELEPHADDPFLRFFYLYQILESLMAENFRDEFAEVRAEFLSMEDVSVTQLKDYIERFQKTYKEKPRINSVFSATCANCLRLAHDFLGCLGEDMTKAPFGEVVYRVRNIIFHDYHRAAPFAERVAELEDALLGYVLEKKLGGL